MPKVFVTFSEYHSSVQMDSKLCSSCAVIAPLTTFLRCINLKLTNYAYCVSKGPEDTSYPKAMSKRARDSRNLSI